MLQIVMSSPLQSSATGSNACTAAWLQWPPHSPCLCELYPEAALGLFGVSNSHQDLAVGAWPAQSAVGQRVWAVHLS